MNATAPHWSLVKIGSGNGWLGAVRQQAITWANVDLDPCRHMTSLGYNELRVFQSSLVIIMTWYTGDIMSQVISKQALTYFECHLGPLLLTWINFNPSSTDGNYIHYIKCGMKLLTQFPNLNFKTAEAWEWITNFIPHFTGHVITYACQD